MTSLAWMSFSNNVDKRSAGVFLARNEQSERAEEATIPERPDLFHAESWGHPPSPPPVPRRTEPQATAALVFGVLGLTVLPFIGPIVAVVLGMRARRRIAASGERIDGKGLADAGFALGIVGVLFSLYFVYIVYARIMAPPFG
jgi:uncharacterized protein DUF4190